MKIKVHSAGDEVSEFKDETVRSREVLQKKNKEQKDWQRKEIENSLSEIYRDNRGNKIDVDRLKINRKQGFVFWFFNFLVFGLIAVVAALGLYYYLIYGKGSDSSAISLEIEAPETITAGEEFYYIIKYNNPEYVAMKNVNLKIQYPEKFIYLESFPLPDSNNDTWNIGRIEARSSGEIKIKGKIINKQKASAIILTQLTYIPENFSSEFKKEASRSLLISGIGFEFGFDYSDMALVGEQGSIKIVLKPSDNNTNYLPNFIIRLEKDKNVEIKGAVVGGEGQEAGFKAEKITDSGYDAWLISGLSKEDIFNITYKVKEKLLSEEVVKIFFEESIGGEKYVFLEKDLSLEVIKSDLNLVLIMNGAQSDQPVSFGERLNYSLSYLNKGETAMKDVAVSVVLESDFLDWTKLDDANRGIERGNIITWTKDQISGLGEIAVDEGGSIDFSIDVLPFKEGDIGKDFKVSAYGEYRVGLDGENESAVDISPDNHSNKIINKINSDMGFGVEARYFDENNLPVGDGPLPPKVGEKTSLKIYWTVTNNLHDLVETKVETILPEGVFWNEYSRTSVGTLSYDESSRKVIWQIGRLPVTVFRADAEFSVSLLPAEDDRNKIMIVLSGATITAKDSLTESHMEKTSAPKTTKLDDDEIANMSSDGVVR